MEQQQVIPQVQFPGEENVSTEETGPDFSKMKKAELLTFIDEHDIPIENPGKIKLDELKNKLAGLFGQFVTKAPDGLEEGNTIHEVVQQIANIDSEEVALSELLAVQDQSNFALFRIGGILAKMRANAWQGDADDFFDYVENSAGMKKRKALYAIAIYEKLVELDIPWSAASKLGWSKLKLIHAILTPENVGEILAQVLPLSNLYEVINFVRDWKTTEGTGSMHQGTGSTPIARMSFQVHEDQKENIQLALKKAKEDGNTEFDGMALEYVCLDFLAGGAKPKPKTKTVMLTPAEAIKYAYENTEEKDQEALCQSIIEAFTAAFPDAIETEE